MRGPMQIKVQKLSSGEELDKKDAIAYRLLIEADLQPANQANPYPAFHAGLI